MEIFIINKYFLMNFYELKNLAHLNLHPIYKHCCIVCKLGHDFFCQLHFLFLPSCQAFMVPKYHSFSHTFNSINNTH
jgi:hypothetical protein